MTKKGGVPDGWLPVSSIGKPVSGTRFLAFKVPLKETLCNNLEPDERFSPAMLLEKEPNLRLVIDLTNTKRYYDKNEFTQNGVDYEKIFCPGREIPSKDLMMRFFNVVDNFMQSEHTEDKFIGVHCTHGINRTGYFICTYMIQKLGFTPDKAISTFQEARGHEIVRDYFITELMREESEKYDKNPEKHQKNSYHSSSSGKHRHSSNQPINHRFRGGPPAPPNQGRQRVSHYSSRPPPERGTHSFRPPIERGPHHSSRPPPEHRRPHHSSRPPPEQRGPPPRDSFGQQSQLNYYEEEDNSYKRFHWRRDNFRGRPRPHRSQKSDS